MAVLLRGEGSKRERVRESLKARREKGKGNW
jgi:hypothetical protein